MRVEGERAMNEFVDFNSARSAREIEKDRISECCRLLTRVIFDMRDLGADNAEVTARRQCGSGLWGI
jgi:hypothetical protein